MTVGQVWAISMVKDEADIIEGTIRHLLCQGVDGILIADNLSTDGTRDILASLAAETHRVVVVDDPVVAYYQAEKMSGLADRAYGLGAEWVVPFDADELWWAIRPLAEVLRNAPPDVRVAEAKLMNYLPTDEDWMEAPIAFQRIVHRLPEHQELVKVAVRWQERSIIWQGNHGVSLLRPGHVQTLLEISHFPYRSEEQFIRKALNGAAAYKAATDMAVDVGAHWRGYGEAYERGGEAALLDIYNTWFHFHSPEDSDPPLVCDPAPYLRR